MTTVRRLATFAAAAVGLLAPLWIGGCGSESCPTEVAKVVSAPASCQLRAGAQVTVTLPLCTKCNQSAPECVVVPPAGDRTFQLDTTAQACTSDASCPVACPSTPPVTACTFTAPALSGNNSYTFGIVDPNGVLVTVPFTVAAGGSLSCTG